MVSSIDILPTELRQPLLERAMLHADRGIASDASTHFSECIMPYVRQLALEEKDAEINDSLRNATIVDNGELLETHRWLSAKVDRWQGEQKVASGAQVEGQSNVRHARKRKVLLLGSGLVAGPAAEALASRSDIEVVHGALHSAWMAIHPSQTDSPECAASNDAISSSLLNRTYANSNSLVLDVTDETATSEAIANADVVVRRAST